MTLIMTFGLLLAVRGQQNAFSQRRHPNFLRVWSETIDFSLSISLLLALYAGALSFPNAQSPVQSYSLLFFGLLSFCLSRYQKKTDIFFFSITVIGFFISLVSSHFFQGLSFAWAVGIGIGFFRMCFLGLQYKLLFSRVPGSTQGWITLFLLAAVLSLILQGTGQQALTAKLSIALVS